MTWLDSGGQRWSMQAQVCGGKRIDIDAGMLKSIF